jgi:hypothetical protein
MNTIQSLAAGVVQAMIQRDEPSLWIDSHAVNDRSGGLTLKLGISAADECCEYLSATLMGTTDLVAFIGYLGYLLQSNQPDSASAKKFRRCLEEALRQAFK